MQQPELGRKIAELRKAKGFTQEELVELCNLNVRTLQRIEAGYVTPRTYTLKLIFDALDYPYFKTKRNRTIETYKNMIWEKSKSVVVRVLHVINFKRDLMKKTAILSISVLIVFLGTCLLGYIQERNDLKKLKDRIEEQNLNSITWFNTGNIEALIQDYADNACFYRYNHPEYCGKEEIYNCIHSAAESKLFQIIAIELVSLQVADSVAIEKSITTSKIQTGEQIKTVNIQEWHKINSRWLIVTDMDVLLKN
uniref:helix-turn-helix domain-containing protein n=1 Tax=uncultured Draconibacterium sp. TaxID=1573823 RepID=UPI003216B8FC